MQIAVFGVNAVVSQKDFEVIKCIESEMWCGSVCVCLVVNRRVAVIVLCIFLRCEVRFTEQATVRLCGQVVDDACTGKCLGIEDGKVFAGELIDLDKPETNTMQQFVEFVVGQPQAFGGGNHVVAALTDQIVFVSF